MMMFGTACFFGRVGVSTWSAKTAQRRVRVLKARKKLAGPSGISAVDAASIWKRAEEMLSGGRCCEPSSSFGQ